MGDKVLVLGTVQGEVPLLDAFHKLGYEVIVVGREKDYPCCSIADRQYVEDIMDYKKMLEIAEKEQVVAVTSNVVERAIRPAAYVSEQMGLESIGYDVAKTFTNKYEMRRAAEKIGIGTPQYRIVRSLDEAKDFALSVGYPLVIKPLDNGGSKGVRKIKNESDLLRYYHNTAQMSVTDSGIIIEEFVEGHEYIVDAFTHDYICDNTDVSIKRHFNLRGSFVSKAVIIQDAASCVSEIERELCKTNKKLVEGIGLKFGITHGEYIYNERQKKVYLVEITARGGGQYLSSHLTPLATGVNVNWLLANYALGKDVLKGKHIEMKHGAAGWYAFGLPKGIIESISGVREAREMRNVYDVISNKLQIGAQTMEMVDDSGKYGPIIIYGSERSDCDKTFDLVRKTLQINVRTAQGDIEGIIW